jgi:hypothetical protein
MYGGIQIWSIVRTMDKFKLLMDWVLWTLVTPEAFPWMSTVGAVAFLLWWPFLYLACSITVLALDSIVLTLSDGSGAGVVRVYSGFSIGPFLGKGSAHCRHEWH